MFAQRRCILDETTTKAPKVLHADLKTLHRQLEELYARLHAERTLATRGPKKRDEPVASFAGR
jgi:hypothetical protein